MKKLLFISLTAIALTFSGCKDEEPTVAKDLEQNFELAFEVTLDGTPVEVNTNYTSNSPELKGLRIDRMMTYISDVELQKADGAWVPVTDVLFYHLGVNDAKKFKFKVQKGDYQAIRFAVGLNAAQNGADPLQFETSHPLSSSKGMYWSWATKYRFVIFEGRVSETGPILGVDNVVFAYHPGHDDFYEIKSYPVNFSISNDELTSLTISASINQMFNGTGGTMDLPAERTTHTTPDDFYIAERYMENIRNGIVIKKN
jgi:hypothetical protein